MIASPWMISSSNTTILAYSSHPVFCCNDSIVFNKTLVETLSGTETTSRQSLTLKQSKTTVSIKTVINALKVKTA